MEELISRIVGNVGIDDATAHQAVRIILSFLYQQGDREKVTALASKIPGAADVHLHQITDRPDLRVNVDRIMASQLGLTQQDVSGSVLVSLSSTSQVAPNFTGMVLPSLNVFSGLP